MIPQHLYTEYQSRLSSTEFPDNVCIVEGKIPVLVSVPHAVSHTRDAVDKPAELNTDVLGFLMCEHTGCHLFVNAGVDGDPSYDASSVYKDLLLKYVQDHDVAMVIDIHGASAKRDFDFELGTAGGKNIRGFDECVSAFMTLSSLENKKTIVDKCFPANGPTRVASYISAQAAVPALQIEINRNLRETCETVCFTAEFLSRYIGGIASVLSTSCREDYKLMWVTRAELFMPRNLILLPDSMRDIFGVNENVDLLFKSGGENFVVKGFDIPEGCVAITGQMIRRYDCDLGHVLIAMRPYSSHHIFKPQAEDIDNSCVLLSDDLYEFYKDYELLEVLNPVDNLRSFFKIKRYEGNVNDRTDSVWLSYYQRKLLGIETPPIISHHYMVYLLSLMDANDARYFKDQYIYDESDDNYIRTSSNVDVTPRLRNIWNEIYSKVRFKGIGTQSQGARQGRLMTWLIKKNTHQLRAARCPENNEIVDAVFISKNSSIALGVSELDYLWITHENRSIRTKVVIVEKDDYPKIVKANCLKSSEEIDMLVCIPMKQRSRLGIYEPGTSVMVERSVKDMFIKSAFAQLMTLLGLFIAIATIPNLNAWHKAIIFVVLVPFIIYSVLASERNKI